MTVQRMGLFIAALILGYTTTGASAQEKSEKTSETPPPTTRDVAYGKHDRQVLDFWKAGSDAPTPVIIYFHGGGFKKGDKKQISRDMQVNEYLKRGISCISANYPFMDQMDVPRILEECEKVMDLVLSKANEWNIDPKRIGVSGCSAGSLISFSLGINRPQDVSVIGTTQQALGTQLLEPKMTKTLAPSIIYQPDPERNVLHAPVYAQMIKDACDKNGVECVVYGSSDNHLPKPPDGKDKYTVMLEFYAKKWGMK